MNENFDATRSRDGLNNASPRGRAATSGRVGNHQSQNSTGLLYERFRMAVARS